MLGQRYFFALCAPLFFSLSITGAFAAPLPAIDPSTLWTEIQKTGVESVYTGAYGDGERLLKDAVRLSAKFGPADLRHAQSCGELGRLLTIRGRFAEAEPLLEQELRVKEAAMDRPSGAVIPSMATLINFYLQHGTASKAEPLTDRMLSFINGKLDEHRAAANGPVKLKPGQPLTGWAGSASLSMRDPAIEWAIACDTVSIEFLTRENYDYAEKVCQASLDVKETVLGKQHLSLANSYDSLGTICEARNQDSEAESFYRYAYENTQRILQPEDPQVFRRLEKLAKCLLREKKFDEAEALYVHAQDLWKDAPSKAGSELRAAYALGRCYTTEGKYEQAAPVLQKALDLAQTYYGPESIQIVTYIQAYADAMHFLGRDAEMADLKGQMLAIKGGSTTQ